MTPDEEREEQRLNALRQGVAQWITSADTKATGLLAVAGALLAAIAFASSTSAGSDNAVEKGCVLLFCMLAVGSIFSSAMVLLPRLDRIAILKEAGHEALSRSNSYFGDLGNLQYAAFCAEVQKSDDLARLNDAREQAFVICAIAANKMSWMRKSVCLLLAGLLAIGAFTLARGCLGSTTPTSPITPTAPH